MRQEQACCRPAGRTPAPVREVEVMHRIIYLVGFLIRQFALPNPFTPFGDSADSINLIVGGVFVPLSYFMVGLIYEKRSAPFWGSILFTIVYAINTGVTYLVCLVYPTVWLMVLIAVAYFALYLFVACKIREAQ